jgi:aspartate kinase
MQILIQKFGGTSLSTQEQRQHVISHILEAINQKFQVVVVVSAMGRKGDPYATDTLLDLITQNGDALPPRETDLLLCCGEIISAAVLCSELSALNISSTVFTGRQAGIRTNENFGAAQIFEVNPKRILAAFCQNKVVIVTGFQGESLDGESTTLGRGGSDTSATVLGVALRAVRVDIFTDVNGILTADPKIVADARPLKFVSYQVACNMAYQGAKVIHPQAVEVAMQAKIPIKVRSTFNKSEGTLVAEYESFPSLHDSLTKNDVTGITYTKGITQLQIPYLLDNVDCHLTVFKIMASHGICLDFISINNFGVIYSVLNIHAAKAINLLECEGFRPICKSHCAKVSIIGNDLNGTPEIMSLIIESLHESHIKILQTADSNTTFWVLIEEKDLQQAINILHTKFELSVKL